MKRYSKGQIIPILKEHETKRRRELKREGPKTTGTAGFRREPQSFS